MRITLDLEEELLRAAKDRAAEQGQTLERFVEDALRDALTTSEQGTFRFVVVDGGGPPRVDVADRDALYDLMEGHPGSDE